MKNLPAPLASLLANPHRTAIGVVGLCAALAPEVANLPAAAKALRVIAAVAGVAAALWPSTRDDGAKDGAAS
jgi:hypothetical protein